MKRGLAAVIVLSLLAPAVAVAASIGSMPGCCAGGDERDERNERITAATACCETTMCAVPAPARQPKAIDAPASPAVLTQLEAISVVAPVQTPERLHHVSSSPPPVRIRLALISTLLI
ncbi:MAG TPA: hypothetical protein VM779_04460 [Thermoanaerobaculia bacterium]|nr:hypothetical protein [Thermoanaerobaculia bacterium]